MHKIKAAVIGTGFIGPVHIEAIRRLGFADVVAIADINDEQARIKADELCISKSYGDYKKLIKDETIDVIHICTPNHLHFPIAKEALLAGKHVICEKPLAMNYKEGKLLAELAEEKGVSAAVNFNLRFYPLIQQARAMVQSGELGRILSINGAYQQDWLLFDTDYNWRIELRYSGRSRAVADIGSHWLDSIEYITGLKVQKVCADFHIFHPARKKPLIAQETYSEKNQTTAEDFEDVNVDTEDYAAVLLKFNNGVPGSMIVSQAAAGRKNKMSFEIYGTEKAIAWDCENPNEMWIGKRDACNGLFIKDPSLMHQNTKRYANYPGGHAEGYPDTSKQLFNNFYSHILYKKDNAQTDFPTFEDGCRELILCETIVNSAMQKVWLDVEAL